MRRVSALWGPVFSAKAVLALVAAAPLGLGAFGLRNDRANQSPPRRAAQLATWDVGQYLRLSQGGYTAGSPSCAFYPLWPAAIRVAGGAAGGRPLLTSLLLTNALSLIGLWFLYRLIERRCGAAISRDSIVLMLAFPGALFFSFPYSESLYFTILMAFFWGLELKRWAWAGVTAFLLPLARPVGIFVLLPVAWYLYERQKRAHGMQWEETGEGESSLAPRLLVLCPLLGYGAYFALMWLWTGNPFEGFVAQKYYPNSPSIKNMLNATGFFQALFNVQTLDGMMDSALDRLFFLLFLALLPALWKMDRTWFWYTLPTGLVPALTNWFLSYRRFFEILFPLFIVLAQLLAKTKRRWIFWYYVVLLAALQARGIWRFVNFEWAG